MTHTREQQSISPQEKGGGGGDGDDGGGGGGDGGGGGGLRQPINSNSTRNTYELPITVVPEPHT